MYSMNLQEFWRRIIGFVWGREESHTYGMNFQEFWRRLLAELQQPKEFQTLKQGKAFEAWVKDPKTITVLPEESETNFERDIPIGQFQAMWDATKNDTKNERYSTTTDSYPNLYNRSYVNTLVDHIVGDQNME